MLLFSVPPCCCCSLNEDLRGLPLLLLLLTSLVKVPREAPVAHALLPLVDNVPSLPVVVRALCMADQSASVDLACVLPLLSLVHGFAIPALLPA